MLFGKNNDKILTAPSGYTVEDIATSSSTCTGETTIGFSEKHTGKLLCAVKVRDARDVAAFYRSYGFAPPKSGGGGSR